MYVNTAIHLQKKKKKADYGINSTPSQEGREQEHKERLVSTFCIIPYVDFHSSALKCIFILVSKLHTAFQIISKTTSQDAQRYQGDYPVLKRPAMPPHWDHTVTGLSISLLGRKHKTVWGGARTRSLVWTVRTTARSAGGQRSREMPLHRSQRAGDTSVRSKTVVYSFCVPTVASKYNSSFLPG